MSISDSLGDPTFFKGGIRVVHFIGLSLGLGTATFLDLMILRFMLRNKIRRSHAEAFEFGTKVVTMLFFQGQFRAGPVRRHCWKGRCAHPPGRR